MSERGAGLPGPELVSVACACLHDSKMLPGAMLAPASTCCGGRPATISSVHVVEHPDTAGKLADSRDEALPGHGDFDRVYA